MPRLTELAHAAVREQLAPGDVAIDATAGNGHDTRFLAELVGAAGRVFAFDVQPEALAHTAALLSDARNVTLLQCDHAEMRDAIPAEHHGRVAAVMFNLGYLPGGNHSFTTQAASTLKAISAALELLRPGGVLTVVAYTGHPGGAEEADEVAKLLCQVSESFMVQEVGSPKKDPSPADCASAPSATSPQRGEVFTGRFDELSESAIALTSPRGGEVAADCLLAVVAAGEGSLSSAPPRLFMVHKRPAVG